jgi:hypothetical protein
MNDATMSLAYDGVLTPQDNFASDMPSAGVAKRDEVPGLRR